MATISASANLHSMQLIQIGEMKQKTILDLIQEMSERQFAEIEQLKIAAGARSRRSPRPLRRCTESKIA